MAGPCIYPAFEIEIRVSVAWRPAPVGVRFNMGFAQRVHAD
jgi:hypothetical protein